MSVASFAGELYPEFSEALGPSGPLQEAEGGQVISEDEEAGYAEGTRKVTPWTANVNSWGSAVRLLEEAESKRHAEARLRAAAGASVQVGGSHGRDGALGQAEGLEGQSETRAYHGERQAGV